MKVVQLFLNIYKPRLDNDWNKQTHSALQLLNGIERVEIIEQNESSNAQIDIIYDITKLPFEKIEKTVKDSGATISIHFPSGVRGITDPYGARDVSITVEETMKKIEGVLSGAISSSGELKIALDTANNNKQSVIDEILKFIHHFVLERAKT